MCVRPGNAVRWMRAVRPGHGSGARCCNSRSAWPSNPCGHSFDHRFLAPQGGVVLPLPPLIDGQGRADQGFVQLAALGKKSTGLWNSTCSTWASLNPAANIAWPVLGTLSGSLMPQSAALLTTIFPCRTAAAAQPCVVPTSWCWGRWNGRASSRCPAPGAGSVR